MSIKMVLISSDFTTNTCNNYQDFGGGIISTFLVVDVFCAIFLKIFILMQCSNNFFLN